MSTMRTSSPSFLPIWNLKQLETKCKFLTYMYNLFTTCEYNYEFFFMNTDWKEIMYNKNKMLKIYYLLRKKFRYNEITRNINY